MTKNDLAWGKIFNKLKIASELKKKPFYEITAKQINEIGKREARHMAKFDTKESLPQLFIKGKLNINAISNGSYVIFKDPSHQSFINLPDFKTITPIKIKPHLDFDLETILFETKMSESNAIDYSHHSKILSTYSGEKELKLTARGRFFSDEFNFYLGDIGVVNVKGVQIEVDAGYEGREQFLIIEAKSSTRLTFNIRQLYYPFRHFQTKTEKRIRTILLTFSNGIYYFTEIGLTRDYYKYEIISTKAYEVEIEEPFKKLSMKDLLSQKTYTPEDVTAPQADDLDKVIDLINFLSLAPGDKSAIAEYFEFNERQGDYYANAGRYIGVIIKSNGRFHVSAEGLKLIALKNRNNRNAYLTELILRTKLFNDLFNLFLKQKQQITSEQIVACLIKDGLNHTTAKRRSSTVKSWITWLANNLDKPSSN